MDHPTSSTWQEPTDNKTKAGYGRFPRPKTPYDLFMEAQDIPIYRDIGVRRVQDLPRKPWKRMGGNGTFIQLLGTEGLWGCYVVEVPGAGALNAEKHMYEEMYLVVEGRGTTTTKTKKRMRRTLCAASQCDKPILSPTSLPASCLSITVVRRVTGASSRT